MRTTRQMVEARLAVVSAVYGKNFVLWRSCDQWYVTNDKRSVIFQQFDTLQQTYDALTLALNISSYVFDKYSGEENINDY